MGIIDFITQLQERVLASPDQPILMVIKDRRPFKTDLRGLDLSNCISILIMDKFQAPKKIPENQLRRFDFVHFYEASHFWINLRDTLSRLDTVEIPQIDQIIDHLIDALKTSDPQFDIGRVRLVDLEEQFLRLAAKIRERHGIPGPKPAEIERFTNKVVMKQVAKYGGLDTAKYIIATPGQLMTDEDKMGSLLAIGYPFMAKPTNGTGGAGITKIEDSEQLNVWLHKRADPNMEYLIEEYIEGDEFRNLALVQPHTIQFFPVTLVIRGLSFVEGLAAGLPATLVVLQDTKKCSIIQKFALKVLRVFQPSPGTLVYIQGFVTKDGTVKLNELTSRCTGTICSSTYTENTGISPEDVQIMAQVRELDLIEMASQKEDCKLCAYIIYPKVEGIVKELVLLPDNQVESEVKVMHTVKVGEKTRDAGEIGDLVARLLVWNEDGEALQRDVNWLKENYKPVIME